MTDVHTPPKRWSQWLGFSLLALLLVGFLAQAQMESRKNIAASEIARLQTLARLSEASLAAHLIAIDQLMKGLRDQDLQAQGLGRARHGESATPWLQHLASSTAGARTISLSDASGTFIASSRPELIGKNYAHRDYFQSARNTSEPEKLIISEPFLTPLNAYSIQLVHPIIDPHQKFQGIVAVTLDPSFFEALLSTSMYAEDLRCLLVHEDGVAFQAVGDFKPAPGINLDRPGSLLRIHKDSGQLESIITTRSYSTGDARIGVLRTLTSDRLVTDKHLVLSFTRNTEKVFATWRKESLQLAGALAALLALGAGALAVHQRRDAAAWRVARQLQAERALIVSQQEQTILEMEDLYNQAPCGYHSLNAQGCFVRINQTELDWLDMKREDVVGKLHFIDLLSDEEAEKFQANFPAFLESGRLENVEFTLKDRHGQSLVVLANATAVKDAHGHFLFSRTTLSDITERKRLETLLKDKSEQLETILNNASVSISMIRDRHTVWANPAACTLFGYSFEEMVGHATEMLYPNQAQYLATGMDIYPELNANKTVVRDIEFKRKDGSLIWGRATLRFVERQSGERETIVLIDDITQKKQAERTIRELMSLIEESPDFIATAGLDKVVSYMNPAGLKMLGYPADTPYSAIQISQAHPAWVNEKLKNEVFPTAHAEGSWRGELALINRKGQEIPVSQTIHMHRNEDGSPSHLSTIVRDISQQKQAAQAMFEAKQAAESANKAKSQFISNMSHDIRTPLSALLTYGRLLEDAPLTPKHRDQLQRLNLAGNDLLGLVNDILDFSKIEAGELHLSIEPTDLQSTLHELKQMMEAMAAQKGLQLQVAALPEGVPTHFMCDPLRIRQMMVNLVGNALKFTHQGSVSVQIKALPSLQEQHHRLRFEVIDTGIGIAEQDQDKLFTRFSQVDDGKTRRYGGTGLGLAIVKELAERMGGKVDVTSQLGRGSTFGIEIELQAAAPAQVRQALIGTEHSVRAMHPCLQLDGIRILVVDDSETNRDIAQQLLTDEGACVSLRGDGLQALEFLRSEAAPIDIILMDVQMPVMDGNTAIALIRQDSRWHSVPVITMTAGATRSERELSMRAGANDYVTKPFAFGHLVRTIRHHIEMHRGQALPAGRPRPSSPADEATAISQDWPVLEGMDLDTARQLMRQDWSAYTRHAGRFLRQYAHFAQLHAWPESDAKQKATLAALHKIVGEAGLLGATALTDRAREAEQQARQSPAADMAPALSALRTEMARVQHVLEPVLAVDQALHTADQAAAPSELDPDQLQALLDDLNAQRFKAFKRFRTLQPALSRHLPAPTFSELTSCIENMDFSQALSILTSYANALTGARRPEHA